MEKEITLGNIGEWWDDIPLLEQAFATDMFDCTAADRALITPKYIDAISLFEQGGFPSVDNKEQKLRALTFKYLIAAPKKMNVTFDNEQEWQDDIDAMQGAFDWDYFELYDLAKAYLAESQKHNGIYLDVLRNLVYRHISSAPDVKLPSQTEGKTAEVKPESVDISCTKNSRPLQQAESQFVTLSNIRSWWKNASVMKDAFAWTDEERQQFETVASWENAQSSRDSYDIKYDIQNLSALVFKRLIATPRKIQVTFDNLQDWEDDIEAMQGAFDWDCHELYYLAEAYYQDVSWNAGFYQETLNRLVRLRLMKERGVSKTDQSQLAEKDNPSAQSDSCSSPALVNDVRREKKSVSYENQEENNSKIRKRLMWYVLGLLVVIGVIILAKYSLTGSVAVSVSIIISVVGRNIRSIMADYVYKQPLWYRLILVFCPLLSLIFGFVYCKKFAEYVYATSGGDITPWNLFAIVAAVMAVVIAGSLWFRKSYYRLCAFLLVLSCCLIFSQCVGSFGYSKQVGL